MNSAVQETTTSRASAAAAIAVAYSLYLAGYLVINRFNSGRSGVGLFLPGEERLPLVPASAPVYAAGFLLPLLILFVPLTPDRFRRLLVSFAISSTVAFAVFLVFPVTYPRPTPEGGPAALLQIAWLDRPANCFPSLHVAVAWLFWLAFHDRVSRPRLLLALVAAICVSTVLVKQHFIADIPAGLALASGAWYLAGRPGTQTRRSPDGGATP